MTFRVFRHPKLELILMIAAVVVLMAAFPIAAEPPFERTEEREQCAHYETLKQPFFGETHLHTAYSFDASTLDTRNTPRDAYRYAKGDKVGLPPWADTRKEFDPPGNEETSVAKFPYCFPDDNCEFTATRTVQLPPGRALDWTAVTDHSEQLGENNICLFEGTKACGLGDGSCNLEQQECVDTQIEKECPVDSNNCFCVPVGWDSDTCSAVRDEVSRLRTGKNTSLVLAETWYAENPVRPLNICGGSQTCEVNAKNVWEQIQQDAEDAYDPYSTCTFTSFIAYEYTAMAANGRCEDPGNPDMSTLLPCWVNADCNPGGSPGSQVCEMDFVGASGADNLHRNIIFRNSNVVDLPISNVEQPLGCGLEVDPPFCTSFNQGPVASPEKMLKQLQLECNPDLPNHHCEFISIPHNPNLSRGSMFVRPKTTDEAQIRQDHEPLVEIMQIKGQSECRFQAEPEVYWSTNPYDKPDELCSFENMNFVRLTGDYVPSLPGVIPFVPAEKLDTNTIPPRAYVRETLKNGILYQSDPQNDNINPFKLGFVGGLDNHNGTPGQSNELQYAKSGAHGVISFATSGEALNEKFFLGLQTNAGGLTVAWAEENSRDSVFTALKNRETYATSGTRPIVRFFGGFGLPRNMCRRGDFAEQGYANGVPMGGMLTGAPSSRGPRFAVSALWDPGWTGQKGTELQRIQIIKGWIDEEGESHEKVFDVTGKAKNDDDDDDGDRGKRHRRRHGDRHSRFDRDDGARVNLNTCEPEGKGHKDLCAVWRDPDFDKDEHSFYYARVLENPSCRWNQHYCNARGVSCEESAGTCRTESEKDPFNGRGCDSNDDCGDGICVLPASYTTWEYQQCCSKIVPKTVQQRAWTSPIWYTPAK